MKRRRTSTRKCKNEARKVDDEESQNSGYFITNLPEEVVVEILLRLPIKEIVVCKSVCKYLYKLISDPKFAKLHFKQAEPCTMIRTKDRTRLSRILYLFQPEHELNLDLCICDYEGLKPACKFHVDMKLGTKFKVPLRKLETLCLRIPESEGSKNLCLRVKTRQQKYKMVNSCNGFLCLSEPRTNNPSVVCNPVTGEFVYLPQTNINATNCICGMGFSPVTNEYKVVRVFAHWTLDEKTGYEWYDGRMTEVYTLGTGSWKEVGFAPNNMLRLGFPTYLNGSIHWICYDLWPWAIIVYFDLDKERFQPFRLPPTFARRRALGLGVAYDVSMRVLGGCLCICDNFPIDIWVMKIYGVEESWTRLFTLRSQGLERWPHGLNIPIKLLSDGGLLMFNSLHSAMVYYKPGSRRFKYFWVRGIKSSFKAYFHTPSLISLKDILSGDEVQVLNVSSRCAGLKLKGECRDVYVGNKALF